MKILIISPFESKSTDRGGRNVDLAANLSELGDEVTFLTSNFDHARKSKIPVDMFSSDETVIKVVGYSSNVSIARFVTHIEFALKAFLKLRKERFDVVFCSTIPPEMVFLSKFLRSDRLVFDVRDIWPEAILSYSQLPRFLVKVFETYCAFIYRSAFNAGVEFVVVAPTFHKWIRKYREKSFRWKFIPLGFRANSWIDHGVCKFQYDYFYAGGITPQFDLREFEGQLSGKIIFLGSGSLFNEVRKIFPDAIMPGVVTRLEADDIMRRSNCVILPSNKNARLPNKAYDYFASNKEVLLGKNVSREIKYLFTRVYPRRRDPKSKLSFVTLSRKYAIQKLVKILRRE